MAIKCATEIAAYRRALACVAIGSLIVLASFPAWSGEWIYDDWTMHHSSKMDDVGDLLSVFGRTSANYLDGSAVGATTYRPLSMATLIIGRLLSDGPLPHHLLSLALHLACVGLLAFVALRLRDAVTAVWVAVLFGLHPIGIEAYGWINGRSDVLACVGLALVAVALFCPLTGRSRAIVAVVGSAVAVLAKETGAVAVTGVALAALLPVSKHDVDRSARLRALAVPVLGCWLTVGVFALMRSSLAGTASAGATSLFEAPGSWTALFRLFAVAAHSVCVPEPRTMGNLGYALAQPTTMTSWLSLTLILSVTMLFLRNPRSLTIVTFAALSVVPCVILRHAFRHGFDRYLYMPLFLVCLAWIVAQQSEQGQTLNRRVAWVGATAMAITLAISTWFTAKTYENTVKHMSEMIELRPDDPTGYLIGAKWLWDANQRVDAHTMIDRVAHTGLPAPLASNLATQLSSMGRPREALAVVDDMARRFPSDPYVLMDVVTVELAQRRLDAVFAAASKLGDYRRFCLTSHDMLKSTREDIIGSADAQRIDHFLANHRCK